MRLCQLSVPRAFRFWAGFVTAQIPSRGMNSTIGMESCYTDMPGDAARHIWKPRMSPKKSRCIFSRLWNDLNTTLREAAFGDTSIARS